MKNKILITLYKRPETVFTLSDISLLFPEGSYDNLKQKMSYFVSKRQLVKPRIGIYAKAGYDPYEFANKLYAPSYVSLETVLLNEGIIFQYSESIFSASRVSKHLVIDGNKLEYRKIKDEILFNPLGVEKKGFADVATKERAFLDMVYLSKNYYFDNLDGLDWNKVMDMVAIYQSKSFKKNIEKYAKSK